jgi:hypothetical protein
MALVEEDISLPATLAGSWTRESLEKLLCVPGCSETVALKFREDHPASRIMEDHSTTAISPPLHGWGAKIGSALP